MGGRVPRVQMTTCRASFTTRHNYTKRNNWILIIQEASRTEINKENQQVLL